MSKVPSVKTDYLPFAEALRELRATRQKSIREVSLCMGWSGDSPYVLTEQGRRMPDQETLLKLVECLGGTFSDQCLLLGLAGYLPPVQVPSLTQIKSQLAPLMDILRANPYPSYILDRGFTYWVANPAATMLVGSQQAVDDMGLNATSAFDLAFDMRLGIASKIANVESLRLEQVRRFKGLNIFCQHEAFYKAYPQFMQPRLTPEDYALFEQVWNSTSIEQRDAAPAQELGYICIEVPGMAKVEFNFFADRVFFLGDFFELVRFNPLPMPDNLSMAEMLFGHFRETDQDCFKIWDVTDAERLLARYRR
ncbi:MAG: helix-turn-helix transcriptional regulator [Anaerolineae bacterium]